MPNINEQVGKRIAEYRKLRGMTQIEFGEKLGKTAKSIQRYEYGITDLPLSLLFSIAEVLKISPNDLISTNTLVELKSEEQRNGGHI